MKPKLHAAAGAIALLTIGTFWISTATSELFGTTAQITAVKTAILWGMAVLIPSLAIAGGTGFSLAKGWRSKLVSTKKTRMKFIAGNGILILLPSAVFLAMRAQAGNFDTWFIGVQALELVTGATNITLLSLNMRDGLAIGRRKKASAAASA